MAASSNITEDIIRLRSDLSGLGKKVDDGLLEFRELQKKHSELDTQVKVNATQMIHYVADFTQHHEAITARMEDFDEKLVRHMRREEESIDRNYKRIKEDISTALQPVIDNNNAMRQSINSLYGRWWKIAGFITSFLLISCMGLVIFIWKNNIGAG